MAFRFVLQLNLLNKTQVLTFLSRNLYGGYLKDSKFQDSEYEVHQVGLKDSGSQNFRIHGFRMLLSFQGGRSSRDPNLSNTGA
jgi:hypothetical protein